MKIVIKSLILSLSLFLIFSTSVSASSSNTTDNTVMAVEVENENGDIVYYELPENGTLEIPIYGTKDGDNTRSLAVLATYKVTVNTNTLKASFQFIPTTTAIRKKTEGFTGEFHTRKNGQLWGNNYFSKVLSGSVSAPKGKGSAMLSGKYIVKGYQTESIVKGLYF